MDRHGLSEKTWGVGMNWSAYEVFSVISGALILIGIFVPGLNAKERLGCLGVGGFFVGYGIFVATRTTGIWLFPIWIFFIPFAIVIGCVVLVVIRRKEKSTGDASAQDTSPPKQREASTEPLEGQARCQPVCRMSPASHLPL
jgi:hypothetical protein